MFTVTLSDEQMACKTVASLFRLGMRCRHLLAVFVLSMSSGDLCFQVVCNIGLCYWNLPCNRGVQLYKVSSDLVLAVPGGACSAGAGAGEGEVTLGCIFGIRVAQGLAKRAR